MLEAFCVTSLMLGVGVRGRGPAVIRTAPNRPRADPQWPTVSFVADHTSRVCLFQCCLKLGCVALFGTAVDQHDHVHLPHGALLVRRPCNGFGNNDVVDEQPSVRARVLESGHEPLENVDHVSVRLCLPSCACTGGLRKQRRSLKGRGLKKLCWTYVTRSWTTCRLEESSGPRKAYLRWNLARRKPSRHKAVSF